MKKLFKFILCFAATACLLTSCGDKKEDTTTTTIEVVDSELVAYGKALKENAKDISYATSTMTITDGSTLVYKKVIETELHKEDKTASIKTSISSYDSSFNFTTTTTTEEKDSYSSGELLAFTITDDVISTYTLANGNLEFSLTSDKALNFFNSTVSATGNVSVKIASENGKIKEITYNYTVSSGRVIECKTEYNY